MSVRVSPKKIPRLLFHAIAACVCFATTLAAHESLWLEAEHFEPIRGFCWPMGTPQMKQTQGHWGLSGPGWAAEWTQGGESGFLSIAAGADDDQAVAVRQIEIPEAGSWSVWVRYGDWREKSERFQVRVEQPGAAPQNFAFGEHPVVEEDNEMKLYWGWSFAWDRRALTLKQGPATISLLSTTKESEPRQIDAIVLTTDPAYRPRIKERPRSATWQLLESFRGGIPNELEPLARKKTDFALPPLWKLGTFNQSGFVYLWNCAETGENADWLSDDPQRVLYPYGLRDQDVVEAFRKKYGGQQAVPIFSDPRVAPTFHGVGGSIFATDPKSGAVLEPGLRFAKWMDSHPDRRWATMMNYHPGKPVGEQGQALFLKYRNRYLGSISGESLGYFDVNADVLKQAVSGAATRRQLADAMTPLNLAANAAKYRAIYGRDLDANAYGDVIPCMSIANITFAPLVSLWGARTLGYESSAIPWSLLGMRWAFMRGIARQGGHLTATYRSCNFGDASTIFSNTGSYHSPQNIYDNYYSVFSGAGMTWYKMDLWYQYMAGSSMFYHEQGFDEFWRPGGTTAAGIRDLELSPKGKLVDRFLRVTAAESDRGHPFTPVAFLVDYAHGWEPSPFWPNAFNNHHGQQEKFRYGAHEQMLQEYFGTAYYPIGPEGEKPMTATNEVYVAGVFGDIFDVIFAHPDLNRWRTIDTYSVVVVAGEIELSAGEGERLAKYVTDGGTLLVADAHLTGPGVAALKLPGVAQVSETASYRWLGESQARPAQRFRFRPIQNVDQTTRVLAASDNGQPICVAVDRGQGRLIYLAIPHGLGIDGRAVPLVPHLFAHLTRGLMPVEVAGDVEWLVNRAEKENTWLVTLLNPAGQAKPQHGITPTDYRENRPVKVRSRIAISAARDRLAPSDPIKLEGNTITCEVPAGGVRILELTAR